MSKPSDDQYRDEARKMLRRANIRECVYNDCKLDKGTSAGGAWVQCWVHVEDSEVPQQQASISNVVRDADGNVIGKVTGIQWNEAYEGNFDRSQDVFSDEDEAQSYARLGLCSDGEAHDPKWSPKPGGGLQAKCKHCQEVIK